MTASIPSQVRGALTLSRAGCRFSGTHRGMKSTLSVLAASGLIASFAHADPAVIIRERAKELRDQNNVRQGVAPPTQPVIPAATPNGPAGPTLAPALLRFNSDINSIHADSQVTPEQKQKLAQEIIA